MIQGRFERHELKYFIHPTEIRRVRTLIAPFMRPDDYAQGRDGTQYTVRSIYFETPDLRFYWEKEAGTKVRKKLRLRTYNDRDDSSVGAFEIKRKYGVTIFKERAILPLEPARQILSEGRSALEGLDLSAASRHTLERFLFLTDVLSLRPIVLVSYEREAYIGRDNPRARVTIDKHVRSMIRPQMDEIHAERDLRHLTTHRQILELKFDDVMPAWMRPVTSLLSRSHLPISKYCRGIELWGTQAC